MNVELKKSAQHNLQDENNICKRRKLEIIDSGCSNRGEIMLHTQDHTISDNSSDMFSDCSPINYDELTEVTVHNEGDLCGNAEQSKDPHSWLGTPLDEIKNGDAPALPPICPSNNHTVFYEWPPVSTDEPPKPYPVRRKDCWDSHHVRMPCSQQNLYTVEKNESQGSFRQRWELIQEGLLKRIVSCQQLETAILSYNLKFRDRWDFSTLRVLFSEVFSEEETDNFFTSLLPQIVQLALQLPSLVTGPVPLLVQHKNQTLSFSQLQTASLLANAFLCTFPRRNTPKRQSEYAAYPDINFNRLYQIHERDRRRLSSNCEKIKCLLHYFRRVCTKAPNGVVSFTRRYLDRKSLPSWDRSQKPLCKLHVTTQGTIEDDGDQMLQVDFANKFLGGGVLGRGCVQEEIRFVICPELMLSRLFTEVLDDTEALLIVGCERYSNYKGYGDTFEWTGDCKDNTPRDSSGRRMCSVVAIDATRLGNRNVQYTPSNLMRELNKAYAGFYCPEFEPGEKLAGVATGNWGCGAFRGDARLKSLIQIMAASQAGRPLAYFTFEDKELRDDLFYMYAFLVENNVTIGRLWRLLCQYYDRSFRRGKLVMELYPFLYQALSEKQTSLFDLPSGISQTTSGNQDKSRSEGEVSHWFKGRLQATSLVDSTERDQNQIKTERKLKAAAGGESDIVVSLADFFASEKEGGSGMQRPVEPSETRRASLLDYLDKYERTGQSKSSGVSSPSPTPKRKISDYFTHVATTK